MKIIIHTILLCFMAIKHYKIVLCFQASGKATGQLSYNAFQSVKPLPHYSINRDAIHSAGTMTLESIVTLLF